MKKTFLIAGGALLAAGAAYAGGLGDSIVEMVPAAPVEPMAEDNGSSIPGWVIPVAILALMVGLAASGSEEDGGDIYDMYSD